ncbi:MAG: hypothetical protein P3W87_006705 [Gammaproteobacteria bacterium]|nr:hypothetical protein [Gammaproteobacteria bacterium]
MKSFAPLKVTLHGMDERAAQMFTMFLAGPARGCCIVVPEGQQEAVIVDLDGVNAERLWLDVRRRFSGPALVLSVREKKLRHSIWVPKPIRADELIDAVERVRTELNTLASLHRGEALAENLVIAGPDGGQSDTRRMEAVGRAQVPPPPATLAVQRAAEDDGGGVARAAELALQERRVHECCGYLADEVYRDPRRRAELFFEPDDTLLGAMREGMHVAKASGTPAVVEGLGHPLILCPDQRRLFSDMREQYLRPLCTRSRHQTPMRVRAIPLEETPITTSADPRLQRLDATLWSVALWTARGRVPSGTSLDAPVSLRAWPNLTRLQIIPGAMQIAALWSKQPTGLMATAERLGLPYRYVFSFFTACQALDLLDQAASALSSAAPSPAQAVPQDRRSLFQRMLNKLGLG